MSKSTTSTALVDALVVNAPQALFNGAEELSKQNLESARADHKSALTFGEALRAAAPDQIFTVWSEAGRTYFQDVMARNVALARKNAEQTQALMQNLSKDVNGALRSVIPGLAA
jgi:hypothetical protein